MKRAVAFVMLFSMVFTTLSGCFFRTGDELYALPQPPDEYLELQTVIESVLNSGAEYAAPVSGTNRQTVQLRDLDGDGEDEAIAFFRSEDEKPLKIYIFRMQDDKYEIAAKIEGDGASIDSIYFSDLDGDGYENVIVGWRMSSGVAKALSIYSIRGWEVNEISQSNYTEYTLADMDNDGNQELVAIRVDEGELTGVVELFDFSARDGVSSYQASLSSGITSISRILSGYLQDGVPALYVASLYGNAGIVTDILTFRSKELRNITLDEWLGLSVETVRSYAAYATDIDEDGAIELPQPVQLPSADGGTSAERYWLINWRSFYSSGSARLKMITHHNYTDGWYFEIPEAWADKIAIRRNDSVSGEKTTTFYIWNGEDEEPIPVMKIYTLSGYNKASRASVGNRQLLMVSNDVFYAYELLTAFYEWEHTISVAEVVSRFNPITTEWNSGITHD